MIDIVTTHLCTSCEQYYEAYEMADIDNHLCVSCDEATANALAFEEYEERIAALELEIAQLRAQVAAQGDNPKPDWSQAPEWAQWWAMDESGDSYWYENEPECHGYSEGWNRVTGKWGISAENIINWRETLQRRTQPGGEGDNA